MEVLGDSFKKIVKRRNLFEHGRIHLVLKVPMRFNIIHNTIEQPFPEISLCW